MQHIATVAAGEWRAYERLLHVAYNEVCAPESNMQIITQRREALK